MRLIQGAPALLFACAATTLVAGGCEDAEAQRRAEVQQVITEARLDMRQALAAHAGPEQHDDLERALDRVIRTLADTRDGEPGQRAAAARLASNAHRELAAASLEEAGQIEAGDRSLCRLIDGMLLAAVSLDTAASGFETLDSAPFEDRLRSEREKAEGLLAEQSRDVADLDGPIAELERQNRDDQAEADGIRAQADELRRDAADRGPAAGFNQFEQSLDLDRRADRIEYEVAQRQVQLRYNLVPEHTLASTAVDQARTRIEAIDGASRSLQADAGEMADEANETRRRLDDLVGRIAEALAVLDESAGPLGALYEGAAAQLEQAATKSNSAAGLSDGDGTDTARLEAARAQQALGDLYRSRARGLAGRLAVLDEIAQAPPAISGAPALAGPLGAATELRAQHDQAVEQWKAAYAEAAESLNRVSARAARSELDALKASLGALLAEGSTPRGTQEVAQPATATAGSMRDQLAARRAANAPDTTGGAETPEALVEALRNAGDMAVLTNITKTMIYIGTRNAEEAALRDSLVDTQLATIELEQAMQEAFGTGFKEISAQMTGAAGDDMSTRLMEGNATLGEVTGDAGAIDLGGGGPESVVPIVRVDGRWYIDGTEQLQVMLASAGAQGMTADGMKATFDAMAQAMRDAARRTDAGEFATVQEAVAAFMQGMAPSGGG